MTSDSILSSVVIRETPKCSKSTPGDLAGVLAAMATELSSRRIHVPDEWEAVYATLHIDPPTSAEVLLGARVRAALASQDLATFDVYARRAILAVFDMSVTMRTGNTEALAAASERGAVSLLSNCSVLRLVSRTLDATVIDVKMFDVIVTTIDCGWRKPDHHAFETLAAELGVELGDLIHVGDDPATDGGAEDAGETVLLFGDVPLSDVPTTLGGGEKP